MIDAEKQAFGNSPAASWLSGEIFAMAQALGIEAEAAGKLSGIVYRLAEATSENKETHLKITEPAELSFLKNATGTLPISRLAGTPERFFAGEETPLIFEEKNAALYFLRHYRQEIRIAQELLRRTPRGNAEQAATPRAESLIASALPFPLNAGQCAAVRSIISSPLTFVSGGPGTGKTALLLRALLCLYDENPEIRIRLAAPTGKAAARMKEAIREQARSIAQMSSASGQISPEVLEKAQSLEPGTLHSLLKAGASPLAMPAPREIDADYVIIDEASMIDQSIMHRLLASVRERTRLVFLGDKNQLDSVGAGRIFGAVCAAPQLLPARTELTESRRFSASGFLGAFAGAIVSGNVPAAEKLLREQEETLPFSPTFSLRPEKISPKSVDKVLAEIFPEKLRCVPADIAPEEILSLVESSRVLAPMRGGAFGTEKLNARARSLFAPPGTATRPHFHGQPILITRNAPRERLYNGDIGVVLLDPQSLSFFAYFRSGDGAIRRVPATLLPDHETAYAMSIHKSQGSEFTRLAVIFPEEDSLREFLSRQLLYTAVTRFREAGSSAKFILHYNRETLLGAVARDNPMRELLFVKRDTEISGMQNAAAKP